MSAYLDPASLDARTEARIVLTPPTHHDIVITRVLDAPRELVFQAWTDPRHLLHWWGPNGFTAGNCELDLRAGGHFRLDLLGPDGVAYPCEGMFREVTPPERIVFAGMADERHPCGAGIPPRSVVTVIFLEQGADRTRLTITARLGSAEAVDATVEGGFVIGWSNAFTRLEAHIADTASR